MRNKFDMQLGMLNEQLIHMGELSNWPSTVRQRHCRTAALRKQKM